MSIKGFIHSWTQGFYDKTVSWGYLALMPGEDPPERFRYIYRDSRVSYGSSDYFRVTGELYYTRNGYSTKGLEPNVKYTAGNGYTLVGKAYGTATYSVLEQLNYDSSGKLILHTIETRERYFDGNRTRYKERYDYASYDFRRQKWEHTTYPYPSYWSAIWEWDAHAEPVSEDLYRSDLDSHLMQTEAGYVTPALNQVYGRLYLSAAQSLPQADVNLIGNVKEAIDYVIGGIEAIRDPSSFLSGLAETAMSPKDLWLQYRYVYKTNQADAKELEELVSRISYLNQTLQSTLSVKSTEQVGDTQYGISMKIPISTFLPDDFLDVIKQFGGRVTPSNVWDLVPYSFMVDWFLGIGDKLKFFEDWKQAAELLPKSVWYTKRRKLPNGEVYSRVLGVAPSVPPLYQSHSASGKVVTMRIADTISIFT